MADRDFDITTASEEDMWRNLAGRGADDSMLVVVRDQTKAAMQARIDEWQERAEKAERLARHYRLEYEAQARSRKRLESRLAETERKAIREMDDKQLAQDRLEEAERAARYEADMAQQAIAAKVEAERQLASAHAAGAREALLKLKETIRWSDTPSLANAAASLERQLQEVIDSEYPAPTGSEGTRADPLAPRTDRDVLHDELDALMPRIDDFRAFVATARNPRPTPPQAAPEPDETWGYAVLNSRGALATLGGHPLLVTAEEAREKGWDDAGRRYAEALRTLCNANTTDPLGPFTVVELRCRRIVETGSGREG